LYWSVISAEVIFWYQIIIINLAPKRNPSSLLLLLPLTAKIIHAFALPATPYASFLKSSMGHFLSHRGTFPPLQKKNIKKTFSATSEGQRTVRDN